MVPSLLDGDPLGISLFLLGEDKDLRRCLARMFGVMRRFDADCDQEARNALSGFRGERRRDLLAL
jgi:hypothetical protein